MSKQVQIEVSSTAPPKVVFEHLAVAKAWKKWSRAPWSKQIRDGETEPNGAGAIRRIWPIREQTVAYEPDHHFGYVLLNKLAPVRNYQSDVYLEPADGGTAIRWVTTADPLLPGTGPFARIGLRIAARYLASSLARHTGRCGRRCPAHP